MATVTKQQLGVEDVQFDTGGAAAVNTFSRTDPDGSAGTYTRLSAAQVPVLDAPIVASARTPFALVSPATDRDVEECLRRVRANAREMKNIEHYGAVAGTGIAAADAERNTQAWRKCLDDINSEGRNNGIYGPGARYEFKRISGASGLYATSVLPFETSGGVKVGNVAVVGAPGTQFAVHSTESVAPFMYATGVSNLFFLDLQLIGNAGSPSSVLHLDPLAAGVMNNINLDRVSLGTGITLLLVSYTSGSNFAKNLSVTGCTFLDSSSNGIGASDVSGAVVKDNVFPGTNLGIAMNASGAAGYGQYLIEGNKLVGGAAQGIICAVSSFADAVHNSVTIKDNRISVGIIFTSDVNVVDVMNNTLFLGGITTTLSAAVASARLIRISENKIQGAASGSSAGIAVNCASANMRRWFIQNNDVYLTRGHGIHISPTGSGRLRGGDISNNMILDPGQNAHNTYDGIMIDSASASTGTGETMVRFNRMTSTAVGLKMRRGITEQSGGLNDFNRYISNMVKGWGTGTISIAGAGSSDAVTVGGASTTIDLLTGV